MRLSHLCSALVLAGGLVYAAAPSPVAAQAPTAVPADLTALLDARQSEMRLVVNRYTLDRTLLGGNYAGAAAGGRGGGGRQGGRGAAAPAGVAAPPAPAPVVPPVISPARIARLKRFDLSWQTAVGRIDAAKLSPAARTDLDALKASIQTNLATLEADTATLADIAPLLPFAPTLVGVLESRLRLEDMKAQESAGLITQATKDIAAITTRIESGLAGQADSVRAGRDQATRAAAAVDALRGNLTAWFNFYNGYDPLFTWWMGVPYKKIDASLNAYATLLRDKLAAADQPAAPRGPVTVIAPAPAPKFSEVPDLNELIALPQDELTTIVARFMAGRGVGGGRGGGRGGDPAAAVPAPAGLQYYADWLKALTTLNFDALSRNAQVNYLYLKKYSELQLAREGRTLPANPPRKADNSGIPGPARGREGLIRDLEDALIPYTPEQLLDLAEKEFAWADREMLKASREMGFGDNWKQAVEKTKTMHVPPGQQPGMIRDLIFEAIDFLRAKDLITVPQVAAESQRMGMMSAQQQLVNPFFTGGAQITVSYPTDTMDYDARLQSMRGNNRPWSHATAHHEMIPGHNLVQYTGQRYAGYRASLNAGGPFFGEGWPLYWEVTLYDMGFNKTPEERVGALVWKMHRCARIIFSLKFHMGQWSPQEAIDFLVDRVGHERDNATAEVRRSFDPAAGYGPLYQAAYLLGGLQIRGLRREMVDSKQMTEKAFHDEILRQGSMPITLLRLALTKQKLTRDMNIDWRFY